MKYNIFIVLLLLFLITSFSGNTNSTNDEDNVFAEILNKDTLIDGDLIIIKITNNTTKDYCFLLDTLSYKIIDTYSNEITVMKNSVFELHDLYGNELHYWEMNDFCDLNKKINKHNSKVKYKRTIKNLLKIKAKSSKIFKTNFNFQIYFSEFCRGNYKVYNINEHNYKLKFKLIYYDKILNQPMIDSIEKVGFTIYKDTLKSNFKPIKINVKGKKNLLNFNKGLDHN